jgi:ectoine hydroxylase-related dioxygenase (phytanoyl-CoA dioxygenase family)
MSATFRLNAEEKAGLDQRGFVVRRAVFDASEVRVMAAASEALVQQLLAEKRRTRHTLGSYMFEIQRRLETIIKWEPDNPDLVQALESFAHLSEELERWALDPRLIDPCKDAVGEEEIALFTEKMTLKRAHKGGNIVLHQDFPYWADLAKIAPRVVTALIYLDDATVENGCLEVVPGSHREVVPARREVDGFGSNEMDPLQYDLSRLLPVEVPAGSVVFFGPFLVHRSLSNRSDADRRALLYSYQPTGHPHLRKLTKLAGANA